MNNSHIRVIFVIGAPGSGKNTLCDSLVQKYKFIHFSAGELLRQEIKKETDEGNLILNIMNQGKIVPSSITCGLLKKAMELSNDNKHDSIFIIDGYPRNMENIKSWEEVFNNQHKIISVLFLDCPLEVCMTRLLKRGETSNRSDDQVEVIKKRFKGFQEENNPILEYMEKVTRVITIDSSIDKEIILKQISEKLDEIINKF